MPNLSTSFESYNELFRSINRPIIILDHDVIVFANDSVAELFQLSKNDLVGKHPYDSDLSPEAQLNGRESKEYALELIHSAEVGKHPRFEWNHLAAKKVGFNVEVVLSDIEIGQSKYLLAEYQQVKQDKKYKEMFDESRDGFVVVNTEGKIIDCNKAYQDMLGYSREELFRFNNFYEITPQKWHEWERKEIWENRLLKQGATGLYQKEYIRKDGSIFPVELQSYVSTNDEGKIEYLWGTARDITQEKVAQEKFRTIFELSPDAYYLLDFTGTFLDGNKAAEEIIGVSRADLIGKRFQDIGVLTVRDLPIALKNFAKNLAGQETGPDIYTLETEGGIKKTIEVKTRPMVLEGKQVVLGIAKDISKIAIAEQKSKEAELFSDVIIDSLPGVFYVINQSGNFVRWNQNFLTVSGYSPKEMSEIHATDLFRDEEKKIVSQAIETVFKEGKEEIEAHLVSKTGESRLFSFSGHRVVREDGTFIVGTGIDITDAREAAQKIRNSEEKFRTAFELAPDAYYIVTFTGELLAANKVAQDMIGKDQGDIVGKNFGELGFMKGGAVIRALKSLGLNAMGKTTGPEYYQMENKDGQEITIETFAKPIEFGGQRVVLGIARDITDRTQAEQKYKYLFELLPDSVIVSDLKGNIIDANSSAVKQYGYGKEELLNLAGIDLTAPEFRHRVEEYYRDLGENGAASSETIDVRADGSRFSGDIQGTVVKMDGEKRVITVIRDITHAKEAQGAIQQANEKAQQYLDLSASIIVALDLNANVEMINSAGAEIMGYRPEEVNGRNWIDSFVPESKRNEVREVFKKLLAGNISEFEYYLNSIITKTGQIKDIRWRNALITDPNGKIVGTISSGQDITELSAIQNELEEKQRFLESIVSNIPNMVFVKEAGDLRFELLNKAGEEIFGQPFKNVQGKNDYDFFPPDQAEFFIAKDREVLEKGVLLDIPEEPIDTPNGKRYLHTRKIPILNSDGEPEYLLGISEDITDRKKFEQEIQLRDERLRAISSALPDIMFVIDETGKYLEVLTSQENLLARSSKSLIGKSINEIFTGEDSERFMRVINDTVQTGRLQTLEYQLEVADGLRWFEGRTSLLGIEQDGKKEIVFVARDITELKTALESLRQNEIKYRTAFNQSPVALLEFGFSEILNLIDEDSQKHQNLTEFYTNNPERLSQVVNGFRIVSANDSALELFNVESSQDLLRLLMQETEKDYILRIIQVIAIRQPEFTSELRMKDSEGYSLTLVDSRRFDYEAGRVFTSFHNLTELKKAEKAAAESAQSFEDIFTTNPIGMFVFQLQNEELVLIASNPAADKILGMGMQNLHGKEIGQAFPNLGVSEIQSYKQVIKTGVVIEDQDIVYEGGGIDGVFKVRAFKLGEDKVVLSFEDETEILKAEAEVKELNELRNKFIKIVAHQFRTPLNSIKWNLETLLGGGVGRMEPETEAFVRTTYTANNEVIKRLNDMLEIMDIEEGRTIFNSEKFPVESLYKSVEAEYQDQIRIKNIDYSYHSSEGGISEIKGDRDKIRIMLDRIMENALLYSNDQGKIGVSLTSSEGKLRFEVKDTGIGIPSEEQERIFTRFYRASNASRMAPNNTGIGLAIVKHYTELHGGQIGFESVEGQGSKFWFEIPITVENGHSQPSNQGTVQPESVN